MEHSRFLKHVAIIMDGNGRWGEQRYGSRAAGHKVGARRVKEIVRHAGESGIQTLTLWAFSTDNWKRPEYEVRVLMRLFRQYIVREADELDAMEVRVTFIGDRSQLPMQLQVVMQQLEERTATNGGLHLQIALNYGGRDEIVRAARTLAIRAVQGQLDAEAVTHADFEALLDTVGVSNPDLVIRTSGELRTSGFMPYQIASSELYFSDCLWPDFTPTEFDQAMATYSTRQRRYGGVVTKASSK